MLAKQQHQTKRLYSLKIDLIEYKVLEEKLLNFSKKNRKNFNLISILKKNGLKKIKQIIIENVHT